MKIDPEAKVVAELDSPTLRVVRDPDGTLQALASASPVRLRDEDGTWRPFDLSLARGAGGLLRTQISPVPVAINDRAAGADGPLAELSFGEGTVLGLDLKVVSDDIKGELRPGRELGRRETSGNSPEDTAKVEALAGLPTRGAPRVSYATEGGVVASLAPSPSGLKTTYKLNITDRLQRFFEATGIEMPPQFEWRTFIESSANAVEEWQRERAHRRR